MTRILLAHLSSTLSSTMDQLPTEVMLLIFSYLASYDGAADHTFSWRNYRSFSAEEADPFEDEWNPWPVSRPSVLKCVSKRFQELVEISQLRDSQISFSGLENLFYFDPIAEAPPVLHLTIRKINPPRNINDLKFMLDTLTSFSLLQVAEMVHSEVHGMSRTSAGSRRVDIKELDDYTHPIVFLGFIAKSCRFIQRIRIRSPDAASRYRSMFKSKLAKNHRPYLGTIPLPYMSEFGASSNWVECLSGMEYLEALDISPFTRLPDPQGLSSAISLPSSIRSLRLPIESSHGRFLELVAESNLPLLRSLQLDRAWTSQTCPAPVARVLTAHGSKLEFFSGDWGIWTWIFGSHLPRIGGFGRNLKEIVLDMDTIIPWAANWKVETAAFVISTEPNPEMPALSDNIFRWCMHTCKTAARLLPALKRIVLLHPSALHTRESFTFTDLFISAKSRIASTTNASTALEEDATRVESFLVSGVRIVNADDHALVRIDGQSVP